MQELPKPVRKKLRDLVGIAHERALRRAFDEVAGDFDRWRRGELNSFDLTERVHRFHNGPAREIYNRFEYRNSTLLFVVGGAVGEGLIAKEEIPPDVLPYVDRLLAILREDLALDHALQIPQLLLNLALARYEHEHVDDEDQPGCREAVEHEGEVACVHESSL